jgi:Bacterial Ig-like domain (group 2)
MSVAWVELEDAELEDAEAEDAELEWAEYDEGDGELYGELYDDSESDDSEESRAAARRRRQAQQRRVANARRRQATARSRAKPATKRPGKAVTRPAPQGRPAPQRKTAAAIRNLDLETKVQDDRLRAAIAAQGKRMSRSEYAAVVGVATNQFIESFDAPDNPYFRAGLRLAPVMLLSPQKRGNGVEAFARDPRAQAVAVVAAITFAGAQRKRGSEAQHIEIHGPGQLARSKKTDLFFADVKDGHGRLMSNKQVTWRSGDTSIATIDPTGKIEAGGTDGTTLITASVDDIVQRQPVTVGP